MQRIDRYGLVALVLIISSAAGAFAFGSGLSVNSAVAYVTGTRTQKADPGVESDGEQLAKKKEGVNPARGGAERSSSKPRGANPGGQRVRPRDDGNLALAEGSSRGDRGGNARREGTQEQNQRQRQYEQERKRREAAALAEAERAAEQQRLADRRTEEERRTDLAFANRRGPDARRAPTEPDANRPVDRDFEGGSEPERRGGNSGASSRRTHVVQSGETMSSIAKNRLGAERRYLEIQKLNPEVDPRRMGAGTRLVLPSLDGSAPASIAQSNTPRQDAAREERPATRGSAAREYTVRSGDTLSQIAQREVGSVRYLDAIRELNPELRDRALHVGAVIQLPAQGGSQGGTRPTPSTPQTRSYRVASGDSLIRIARRELGDGDLYTLIQDLNPRVNPAALVIGSTLELPARGSAMLAQADGPAGRR